VRVPGSIIEPAVAVERIAKINCSNIRPGSREHVRWVRAEYPGGIIIRIRRSRYGFAPLQAMHRIASLYRWGGSKCRRSIRNGCRGQRLQDAQCHLSSCVCTAHRKAWRMTDIAQQIPRNDRGHDPVHPAYRPQTLRSFRISGVVP
jgi:hypothetical protein